MRIAIHSFHTKTWQSGFLWLMSSVLFFGIESSLIAESHQTDELNSAPLEWIPDSDTIGSFFPLIRKPDAGNILVGVQKLETDFLIYPSLIQGLGSNDVGLDRHKLGRERVVRWKRHGSRLFLLETNWKFRANSDSIEERNATRRAFAESVLAGFDILKESDETLWIDVTPFLMSDLFGIGADLKSAGQGDYRLDSGRSAVEMDWTKSFPDNTEFSVMMTFSGSNPGSEARSVTPDPNSITMAVRQSWIRLPELGEYQPRVYDPRSGYFNIEFQDYASSLNEDLVHRWICRHRLEKVDPSAEVSPVKDPIIYYLDPGVPEPVRSALLDGARWWAEGFEAAGFENAYRVEVLPAGADPLDVRYNVINWTHRQTRGWSYGSTVIDPRNGEILKGHVLLGSLRVRQDMLIAQAWINAFESGESEDPRPMQMALARLRQLSAHEVGHTLGIRHNFAASSQDRASVMDYPHPLVAFKADGELDFSQAYDVGIGEWDKRAILYGYSEFQNAAAEKEELSKILKDTEAQGWRFLTDQHARDVDGIGPNSSLWDNGSDPVAELNRLIDFRSRTLKNFDAKRIRPGSPFSELETTLVPLYYGHRYQLEAVTRMIGGLEFDYAVRGESKEPDIRFIPLEQQRRALAAALKTAHPDFLEIPENILRLVPPNAPGYGAGREGFPNRTGTGLDLITIAESAAAHTYQCLISPKRINRILEQKARFQEMYSVGEYLKVILENTSDNKANTHLQKEIARSGQKQALLQMLRVVSDPQLSPQGQGWILAALDEIEQRIQDELFDKKPDPDSRAHLQLMADWLKKRRTNPESFQVPSSPDMPPGSPIGCSDLHFHP